MATGTRKSAIAKAVKFLCDCYPHANVTVDTARAYEIALQDIEPKHLAVAIEVVTQTSRFFPAISDIRAAAFNVRLGPVRTGEHAWGVLLKAIRHVGAWRPPPRFRDPVLGECVRLLGWVDLCTGQNEAADRARFCKLYDDMARSEREAQITGVPQLRRQLAQAVTPLQLPKG